MPKSGNSLRHVYLVRANILIVHVTVNTLLTQRVPIRWSKVDVWLLVLMTFTTGFDDIYVQSSLYVFIPDGRPHPRVLGEHKQSRTWKEAGSRGTSEHSVRVGGFSSSLLLSLMRSNPPVGWSATAKREKEEGRSVKVRRTKRSREWQGPEHLLKEGMCTDSAPNKSGNDLQRR